MIVKLHPGYVGIQHGDTFLTMTDNAITVGVFGDWCVLIDADGVHIWRSAP